MPTRRITTSFNKNPGNLLLIDGFGAMLSAFLLGIVLVKFESFFGIPVPTLYLLASIPIVFATYDFYNYRKRSNKLSGVLSGIAIMNFLYCILSIGAAFFHRHVITSWGWMYILVEVGIVIALAVLELRVAKSTRSL